MSRFILFLSLVIITSGIIAVVNFQPGFSQTENKSLVYKNADMGIKFNYPSYMTASDFSKDCITKGTCVVFLHANTSLVDDFTVSLRAYLSDKPLDVLGSCDCDTLMDFVRWEYKISANPLVELINDNETLVNENHSSWQMETQDENLTKQLIVWTTNGNKGYKFVYSSETGPYGKYLPTFRGIVDSIEFVPFAGSKQPSFLSSPGSDNEPLVRQPLQSGTLKILGMNSFADSAGYLHIVGEIENNTPAVLKFVKVVGTFYDKVNGVVATDFTFTDPSDIGPGDKAPFNMILTSASIPLPQIDHYKITASGQ